MIGDLAGLTGAGQRYDVCVVGGGPAGIALALTLGEREDLRICLVESGGVLWDEDAQKLADADCLGRPFVPMEQVVRGLGGSTQVWSGRCCRLDPIDFATREWVAHSGWPIDAAELEPYYGRAQTLFGFRRQWGAGEVRRRGRRVPAFDPQLFRVCDWRFPAPRDHARLNWARLHLEALRRSLNIAVLPNASAVRLEPGEREDEIAALRIAAFDGSTAAVGADSFVLCCGGIENARLMLASPPGEPGAAGNRFDRVGRYYMQHVRGRIATVEAEGRAARRLRRAFGISSLGRGMRCEVGLALASDAQERERLLNASASLIYEPDPESARERLKDAYRVLRAEGPSRRFWRGLARAASRLSRSRARTSRFSVVVDLEQVPDAESRVCLSDRTDRFGSPLASVHWRASAAEQRTARRFAGLLAAEFARLGLGEVKPEPWLDADGETPSPEFDSTCHHMATTRMSQDPREGVVDRDCRVHGISNLYIAGSSVFATGGHANPTLSIVALAVRLAEHLKGREPK